ncbi:MAG: phospholipid carrier-dependent glycosyltransferase [Planctomycetota bacterium]|nr:MAG: phospholipid carrier-dependent glycosyltransferase [Planctomycetota bacterium]
MGNAGGARGWWALVLVWLLGFGLPASLRLPVTRPSEMRYVEAARQMDVSGSWAVPVMHGEVYAEKPPLWFWATIAGQRLTGDYVHGARLVSVASCTIGALATARLAATLFGPGVVAPLAGALLSTSVMLIDRAYRPLIDPLLFGLCTLALWGLVRAAALSRWRRVLPIVVAALALSAAVLTKGPVGVLAVLLGAITIGWAWRGRRGVSWLAIALALATATGIGLGWLAWASGEVGSWYWDRMLFGQVATRVAHGAAHEEPWWFYLPSVLVHWLPWTVLLPGAVLLAVDRDRSEAQGAGRGALLWVGLGLLVFSLFSGKRTGYLMPFYPGLALATAWAVVRAETGPPVAERWIGWPLAAARWLYPVAAAVFALGALATALLQAGLGQRLPRLARAWAEGLPASAPIAPVLAAIAFGVLAVREHRDAEPRGRLARRTLRLALAVALGAGTVLWTFLPPLARRDDPAPALREIAAALGDHTDPVFYGRRLSYAWSYQTGRLRAEVLETPEQLAQRLDAPGALQVVTRGRDWRRLPDAVRARLEERGRWPVGSGIVWLVERESSPGDGGR